MSVPWCWGLASLSSDTNKPSVSISTLVNGWISFDDGFFASLNTWDLLDIATFVAKVKAHESHLIPWWIFHPGNAKKYVEQGTPLSFRFMNRAVFDIGLFSLKLVYLSVERFPKIRFNEVEPFHLNGAFLNTPAHQTLEHYQLRSGWDPFFVLSWLYFSVFLRFFNNWSLDLGNNHIVCFFSAFNESTGLTTHRCCHRSCHRAAMSS